MTQDEIIDMAMKAEFVSHGKPSEEDSELFVCTDEDIVHFAKLIAKAEREACLKACEKIKNNLSNWPAAFEGVTAETKFMRSMGETIAQPFIEAIQSRGQT
jgi:mevalonate kinase